MLQYVFTIRKEGMKVFDLDEGTRNFLMLTAYKAYPFAWESPLYDDAVMHLASKTDYKASLWFWSNVALAYKKGYKGLSVKLTSSYWNQNVCKIGVRGVRKVLTYLQDQGCIEVYKGSKDLRTGISYPSIVVFKEALKSWFSFNPLTDNIGTHEETPLIVLKRRQDKTLLSFGYTPSLMLKSRLISGFNQSLKSLVLTLDDIDIPCQEYQRSFLDDFDKGGRFYTKGSGFQGMKVKDRLRLKMQGEGISELDYIGMHPNLLYEIRSQEKGRCVVPQGFDAYDVNLSLKVDSYSLQRHKDIYCAMNYNPVRNLFKFTLLLMINCNSFRSSVLALRQELYKDKYRLEVDKRYVGLCEVEPKEVFEVLLRHNRELKDYFFSDSGVYLQNIDSEIASLVIDSFVQRQEPVLCWHDSFVTRQSQESMLYCTMKKAWKDYLGSDEFCRVSKKTL